jgi:hypothetical protein
LSLSPRHWQIREALWAAWLFSGSDSLESLTNAPLFTTQLIKLRNRSIHPLPAVWNASQWTALDGWGSIETWNDGTRYRWSTAKRSTLLLPPYSGTLKRLTLKALPYHAPNRNSQSVTAWLGTVCLGKRLYADGWQEIQYDIPLHAVPGERRLMLEYQDPASPSMLKRGNDPRLLALALSDIRPAGLVPFRGDVLSIGDPEHAGLLGSEWSHPETWADGTRFRWLEGTNGVISWDPTVMERAGTWEIEVLPFSVPGRQQSMRVIQGETILTNIVLQSGWNNCSVHSPPVEGNNGLLQLQFSYAESPRTHNMGNDPRKLSAAVSRVSRR